MATLPSYPIHPVASVINQIAHGEDPWVAINSFFHDWWRYAIANRQDLIEQPPASDNSPEVHRWAAFCAAAVEELCRRTSFPSPAWIEEPAYVLQEPWFLSSDPSDQEKLIETSLEPFKRRNIFFGSHVLDNKYELQSQPGQKPGWEVWTDQELQDLLSASCYSPQEKSQ